MFEFRGEQVSGKALERIYESILAAKVTLATQKLYDDLGLTAQVREDMNNGYFTNPVTDPEILDRITKAKADINVRLSKKLIDEMADSDRFSYDLIIAAQLNSKGEFIIPLNDELQFDRIQQTINALIRRTITKQKTQGAQLYQVSDGIRKGDIELSNALSIEFDVDAEGKKYIKYFEAELPAYLEAFYKDYTDEFNYLRVDWMPESFKQL